MLHVCIIVCSEIILIWGKWMKGRHINKPCWNLICELKLVNDTCVCYVSVYLSLFLLFLIVCSWSSQITSLFIYDFAKVIPWSLIENLRIYITWKKIATFYSWKRTLLIEIFEKEEVFQLIFLPNNTDQSMRYEFITFSIG